MFQPELTTSHFNILISRQLHNPIELEVSQQEHFLKFPDDLSSILEKNWQTYATRLLREGKHFHESVLPFISNILLQGNTLKLEFGKWHYREYIGLCSEDLYKKFNAYMPMYCLVGGIVETKDGYLAVNQRKNVAEFEGYINLHTGGIELHDGTFSPCKTCMDEIHEESGIPRKAISHLKCIALVRNIRIPKPHTLCFHALTTLTKGEIENLQQYRDMKEGPSKFIPYTYEGLHVFLQQFTNIMLSESLAMIYLLGTETFGNKWGRKALEIIDHSHQSFLSLDIKGRKLYERNLISLVH